MSLSLSSPSTGFASSATLPIAVLGVGGVGGAIAARTGAYCVASERTAAVLREHGLRLVDPTGERVARVPSGTALEHPVGLLVVAVKAYDLEPALERVAAAALPAGSVVLPLQNGLESVERTRALLRTRGHEAAVVAGSIGRFEAFVAEPGSIVQRTERAVVTVASDTLGPAELDRALAPLDVDGMDVARGASEREVLWGKAARLSVLAAATVATRSPLGEIVADPRWRERLRTALSEACAAAAAEGVDLDAEAEWRVVEALPATLTTSAARDASAGRATELDAITGSVVRAAARHEVATPTLTALLADAEATCRLR